MASYDLKAKLAEGGGTWTFEPQQQIATRSTATPREGKQAAPPPLPCIHLGDATETTALVKCGGCRGNVRLKVSVSTCEIFGSCLPTAAHENSSGVKGCGNCPRRSTNPPEGEVD